MTKSAKNLSINLLKQKKDVVRDYDFERVGNNPKNRMIYNFMREVLDNEEYDIIMEHVVYGKTLKEISKMMKCNSNTLKSKYLRAINKLKEKGGDYFG